MYNNYIMQCGLPELGCTVALGATGVPNEDNYRILDSNVVIEIVIILKTKFVRLLSLSCNCQLQPRFFGMRQHYQ